jgi:hypothetical protein
VARKARLGAAEPGPVDLTKQAIATYSTTIGADGVPTVTKDGVSVDGRG